MLLPKKGNNGSDVQVDSKAETPLGQWLSGTHTRNDFFEARTATRQATRQLTQHVDPFHMRTGLGLPVEYSSLLISDGFEDIDTLLVRLPSRPNGSWMFDVGCRC
jgi:hypothetical protein